MENLKNFDIDSINWDEFKIEDYEDIIRQVIRPEANVSFEAVAPVVIAVIAVLKKAKVCEQLGEEKNDCNFSLKGLFGCLIGFLKKILNKILGPIIKIVNKFIDFYKLLELVCNMVLK